MLKLAQKLIEELNQRGVKCYLWHTATSGSTYIRFEDNRIGSIRISDHKERDKLKYKFNIRFDNIGKNGWRKENDRWRYFVQHNAWRKIIPILQKQAVTVLDMEKSKYTYFIPKFKRNGINIKL